MSAEVLETEDEQKQEQVPELKVKVYDPNEVDIKGFKFKTAKQLDQKLRRAERILAFEDPENPDEPINVHLRALTSNEEAILYKSRLSKDDLTPLVDVIMKKAKKGEEVETSDVVDVLAKKLVDTTDDDADKDRFYRRIQMGIVKPRGVTIQWLERRNPEFLNIVNETIDELAIENDLWVLHSVNKEAVDERLAELRINSGDTEE